MDVRCGRGAGRVPYFVPLSHLKPDGSSVGGTFLSWSRDWPFSVWSRNLCLLKIECSSQYDQSCFGSIMVYSIGGEGVGLLQKDC